MIQTMALYRFVIYTANRKSNHVKIFIYAIESSLHTIISLSNQKFKSDPYTTTLGGFSKVTNYLFDTFRVPELECHQQPSEEVADLLGELIPGLEINQQEEPGFEVITRVSTDLIAAQTLT